MLRVTSRAASSRIAAITVSMLEVPVRAGDRENLAAERLRILDPERG
jgi:hypothetical protein